MTDIKPTAKPETATLIVDGKEYTLPIKRGTTGDVAVDITGLFQKSAIMTFDRGYTSTASCESEITFIDGDKGVLLYRGYPIEQIAEKSNFLEASYLLLNGELPNTVQMKKFERDIADRMSMHEQMRDILNRHKRETHPMKILQSMVTTLGEFHKDADPATPQGRNEIALNLIAKMPVLVAMVYRHSKGMPPVFARPEMGYTENFMRMCFASDSGSNYSVDPAVVNAMDRIFILHADHEQNASTSTVRLAGSTGTEAYAAISAGIAALAGPAHGGANEAVLKMLDKIGSVDNIPGFIAAAQEKGAAEKLMGFGHRVYKNFDPRAQIIKGDCDNVLNALGVEDPRLDLAMKLEQAALAEPFFKQRNLYPNVDFYSGIILSAVGFQPTMFTPLFALARTVGWAAQWLEQAQDPNTKIGRPRQLYMGETVRHFPGYEAPSGAAARATLTAPAGRVPTPES